ncbi:MAG: YggS family pyridoxal phosphate-dependent enzyme [Pseudomonadota bacterium]
MSETAVVNAGLIQRLQGQLTAIEQSIAKAAEDAGRTAADVTLIAASKTQAAATIEQAHRLGISQFGENYLDEALAKIDALKHLSLTWHYIGRIQSNKTRQIAQHFDWIHTVDRAKIAQRLSDQRESAKPLSVLIQVNLDQDPNKAGVTSAAACVELAQTICALPNLRARGLMTILNPASEPAEGYASVAQLAAEVAEQLPTKARADWQMLSMGMSQDLHAAVAAGATHVRLGTALFGPRS